MPTAQGWRNDSRGGGTRPWGPRGKGSRSVSKGPEPPIQLLQLLKNSQREVKRAHFVIYWVPGSHPGSGINGARRGRSLPVPPPPPVSPAMTMPSFGSGATLVNGFQIQIQCECTYVCTSHVPNFRLMHPAVRVLEI